MSEDLLIGVGGPVETQFVGYRPSSCLVDVLMSDGTVVVTGGVCTLDPVVTTLATQALVDSYVITLTSGANVSPRARYLLGDEELTIKSISGATVQLWAGLARDHAAGEPFVGVGVGYTVPGNLITSVWWDGIAVFTPNVGDTQTEVVTACRRKIPERLISEVDIRAVLPMDRSVISASLDLLKAFDDARENMMLDIGGKARANTILGVKHFRRICAHRFWLDRELEFGSEWAEQMARLRDNYAQLRQLVYAEAPFGNDDGTTTPGPGEGAFPQVDLEMA